MYDIIWQGHTYIMILSIILTAVVHWMCLLESSNGKKAGLRLWGSNILDIILRFQADNTGWFWYSSIYSGLSLKGHSLERTSLYIKRHNFLAASTDCECIWCSLSPKDTSLIRTDFFGRRGALIRGGLLYNDLKSSSLVYFPPYLSNDD